ncbi:MAG: magnesium transporter [Candidatus Marinimicrobia bacterium]|jgi:magnesium transporter|nr:magnesium transporter [Candidatus Neomarinimicrobiota bacterium]
MNAMQNNRSEMLHAEVNVLLDTFRRLLRRRARTNLEKLTIKTHPADLALLFRHFSDEERQQVFTVIQKTETVGEFLPELDESIVEALLEPLDASAVVILLEKVSADDRADILNLLPEEKANSVLKAFDSEESEELEELMSYAPDTAGGIMSVDPFSLSENTTAAEAVTNIQSSEDAEMVFYLYVTDEKEKLTGVVSLRDLVVAPPNSTLKSFMLTNVVAVTTDTDQEEVARQVSRYNLLAIPVVDADNTLLGIVTVDDVVDVIREEATEDFLQMAGIGKDREILMKSTWENARLRLPWLFASWIGGTAAVYIIGWYQEMLTSIVALAAFIPVIVGMGGNIGTQSSTIIIRGIATGRVQLAQASKVILKEIGVGVLLGVFYGILLGIVAYFKFIDIEEPMKLGLVVGLAIFASMLIATSIGTLVPILLRKVDVDPAIASGPFVTTSTDVLGILLYFIIANSLLHTI